MSILWITASLLGALSFYLGSPHQRLWPGIPIRTRYLRIAGSFLLVAAALAAAADRGIMAGLFSALPVMMLGGVLLPYLDAWRRIVRADSGHAG